MFGGSRPRSPFKVKVHETVSRMTLPACRGRVKVGTFAEMSALIQKRTRFNRAASPTRSGRARRTNRSNYGSLRKNINQALFSQVSFSELILVTGGKLYRPAYYMRFNIITQSTYYDTTIFIL
jgi:hypothetical protein